MGTPSISSVLSLLSMKSVESPSAAVPPARGRCVTVTRRAPTARWGVKNSLVDTWARLDVHWFAAICRISSARA